MNIFESQIDAPQARRTNGTWEKKGEIETLGKKERQVSKADVEAQELRKKFINCLMKDGKQSTAERILHRSCRYMLIKMEGTRGGEQAKASQVGYLRCAVRNVKPLIEFRVPTGSGRAPTNTAPTCVPTHRANKMAIQWLIEGASKGKRSERTMARRLYLELLDAYQRKGYAMKKREELHNINAILGT